MPESLCVCTIKFSLVSNLLGRSQGSKTDLFGQQMLLLSLEDAVFLCVLSPHGEGGTGPEETRNHVAVETTKNLKRPRN